MTDFRYVNDLPMCKGTKITPIFAFAVGWPCSVLESKGVLVLLQRRASARTDKRHIMGPGGRVYWVNGDDSMTRLGKNVS